MLGPLIFYLLLLTVINRFIKNNSDLILFVGCILSRSATSIYYIEDIDSLRFALSIKEYSLINLQPHFPGYPVFCFVGKLIFFFTDSLGITFSIIGGVSVYIIIYYCLKISRLELSTQLGVFCSALIFFNPFLWLMSNRYMPDIMGMAVAISAIYYLTNDNKEIKYQVIGFFLVGILSGTRLSYLPLLIVPFFYSMIINDKRAYLVVSLFLGCIVWFLPLIWLSGYNNLYMSATAQTVGHFSDFGGTVFTDSNWYLRLKNLIRSIWGDGLGGYWLGRSWQTLILSLPLFYFVYQGVHCVLKQQINNKILQIILYSLATYIVWIFFFQNIIHKSRHILPVLVIILLFIVIGQKSKLTDTLIPKVIIGLFFICLIPVTSVIVNQHSVPTAVSKLKDNFTNSSNDKTIISIPLINYYLKKHGIKANYISTEDIDIVDRLKKININEVRIIGSYSQPFFDDYKVIPDTIIYHNPYVNRMWSKIETYRLELK